MLEEINNNAEEAELESFDEESEMVLTLKKVPKGLQLYIQPFPIPVKQQKSKKSMIVTKQVEVTERKLSVSDSK